MKDDTNKQHKPDFVHFSRWPSMECHNSNIGETVKHLSKSVIDQAGRDTKSHIVRHCSSSYHKTVNIENFKILNMEYNKNTYKRRMSKALFVKQYCPSHDGQDNFVPLQLFN